MKSDGMMSCSRKVTIKQTYPEHNRPTMTVTEEWTSFSERRPGIDGPSGREDSR